MKTLHFALSTLALTLALGLAVGRAGAQETLLLREIVSREITVDVGGRESLPAKTAESREVAIFVEKGPSIPFGAVISREHDLAIVTATAPPALNNVAVSLNATGTAATLDWSTYNFLGVGAVQRFDIYLSDSGPFTSVAGLTPFASVGGATTVAAFANLPAYRDHFFAVVAVDALGRFSPAVNFAAGYVLAPQVVSREFTVFFGDEAAPSLKQAISREMDLAITDAAAPPRVAAVSVNVNAAGDIATLDWSAYNFLGVGDVQRFDIYLSDTGPFTSVAGLTPFATTGGATTSITFTGLIPGRDHYFAVVPVDARAHFDSQVNFAAAYVLVKELVSREVTAFIGEQPAQGRQALTRELSMVVPDAAVPAPVTGENSGFVASTSGAAFGAVDLDWTSYNEFSQNDVARYRVYVGNSFFSTVAGLTPYQIVQTGRQVQTVTGLTGGNVYHFAVVAEDVGGRFNPAVRSFSAQASISGVGEVTNLSGASSANAITFNWQPPAGAGSFLRGYHLYFGGATVPIELPTSATSYQATGLQPATGYPLRIATLDPFGSESGGVSLVGATLLPNPANAQLTARGGQVVLIWNAAQPTALVASYEVYRSDSRFTDIASATRISADPATEATLGSFAAVSGKFYAVVTVNVLGGSDPAVVSIEATKQFQTINFSQPTLAGSASVSLQATATSGLPVRFDAPAEFAAIDNNATPPLLTAKKGGLVTINAIQDGNANFWPADPVARQLRLLPVITSFSASGVELTPGLTLRNNDEILRVVAPDADGIARAEFFIRPAGNGAFTSLGVDANAGDGLAVVLAVDAFAAGAYELKVVVQTPSGFASETTRSVNLQLGLPSAPVLTAPQNGSTDAALVTVSGTASRGSQVAIFRNGTQIAGPLALTNGAFSASVTLLPGENVFTARASNGAGSSADSAARTVTLRSLLTLEITPASLAEGASGSVKVIRNHAQGAAAVALASNVAGQLTLPASVTIAAGATQATAAFTAIDDTKAEADSSVMITGSAAGYVSSSASVTVLDDDRTNLPDLIVTSITAPAQAAPGQEIELVWSVKNQGAGKADAGWTDQIFLSADAVLGGDQLVGTFIAPAPLLAGQTVERRARVTIPAVAAGPHFFAVRANGGGEVFEDVFTNNSAIDDTPITIQTALGLDLGRASIAENADAFNATITRNGDTGTALNVTLSTAPGGALTLPATVSIPAGATTATFAVAPLNDTAANGPRTVTLTARAASYADVTANLTITDDDAPGLVVEIAPVTVVESAANPAATGTVRRNTATTAALTVGLVSSNGAAASAPASIVIPAGAAAATFPITVYDDDVLSGTRAVRFTASATGLATNSATLDVTDDDIPSNTLRLVPAAVTENAASPAAFGRIVRDRAADRDVVFRLSSGDVAQATVPAEVTLPAGLLTIDFPIAVLDNALTDGARDVTITATETDSVLHSPIAAQSVLATLHIFDNEGATLALSASAATVVAGQTLNGTVSRAPGTSGGVNVALASSSPALTVPASVALADGVASANFTIRATSGGTAPVDATITASAAGLNSAALALTVIGSALPDLAVATITPQASTGEGGSTINVSWTVENDGSAPALGAWTDRVFLTTDRQAAGGTAVATVSFAGPLAVGTGYSGSAPITLPAAPGRYWIVVRTDTQGDVAEGAETNNALVAAQPIEVQPAYRVTVATNVDLAASGTPVPLTGKALRTGDDSPVAQVPVTVRILVNGTRRVLGALTDNDGNFLTTFRPLPSEAGHYSVAAAQPDVTADVVQDQFDLIGLGAEPNALELRLAINQPVSGEITLRNLSDRPLSGLSAVLQGAAANISATLTPPASLAANGTAMLHYTLTAANATITRAKVTFHLTSSAGAVLDVPVQLTVLPIASQLVANPGTLTRGMLRGVQTLVECELVNLGAAPSGDLAVELPPTFPWMKLASPAAITSLAPGERTKITLQLLPAADLPLQLYTGLLFIRAAQSGLSIPFQFRAISEAVGDVAVNVLDDYTYYTPGAPRVADATVKLRDPFDQSIVVAQGLTDETGAVTLPAVREGSYFLEVSAAKHGTYRNGFIVVPGITNPQDVFIDRRTVTYTWQVVPTEIPDRYEIKLVSTFEVDVPVPVVTMEVTPGSTIPELAPGESIQLDVKLENHGLIAAEQVSLHVPGLESGFEFLPLIRDLDQIAAKSSVTIPMVIRRPVAGGIAASLKKLPLFAGGGGGGGGGADCPFAFAVYSYECGKDRRYHQVGQPFTVSGSAACPGGGGGGGFPFVPVGEAGPGGSIIGGPGVATNDDCDPCGGIKIKALLQCGEKFLPFPDWFKCGKGVFTCYQSPDLYKCVRTGMTCAKAAGYSIPFGKPLKILDCIYIFIKAAEECDKKLAGAGGSGGGGGGGGGGGSTPAAAAGIRTVARFQMAKNAAGAFVADAPTATALGSEDLALIKERAARMQSEIDALIYIFGDAAWINSEDPATWQVWIPAFLAATETTSDGGEHITAAERAALLALPLPADITAAIVTAFLDRNNRSLDYYAAGIFNSAQVPANGNPDFVARDILGSKFGVAVQSDILSAAEGFASNSDGLRDAIDQFRSTPQKKTQGVCAHVKIEIDQQAVLTRSAFAGTLEVTNSSETSTIEEVSVVLDIRDANGNSANDKFFIRGPEISGLANAGGRGQLAAGATGRLEYTFIPKRDAAPEAPTVYNFAGTLQYSDNGQAVALPMLPSPVTVYPDARLTLKYFQQRDVFSDDPFTPEIEPAEPFALGLIVTNEGRGLAKQMKITSAQPKIIDNKKGLLIDFKIIGTQVGAQTLNPSLTVNLGDIEPGAAQVAQFLLTASLQGKFIDYQASFEHGDELGGAATSLIDGVEIHELIHTVRDDRSGADALPDFLTNEVRDANSLPDTLYLSTGAIAPVNPGTNAAATIGALQGALTANQPAGWSFVQVADPGAGLKLTRAVRSDGKVLRIGDNLWQTDRSFPNALTGATRERLLHLLDFDGTGAYTLYYTQPDAPGFLAAPVTVAQLGPVVPAVRTTPLDTIDVVFSRPIDAATFTAADITLRLNDAPIALTGNVLITAVGEASYRIAGLAGLNAAEGTYVITVQAGTIADVAGRAGQGAASAVWALSTSHLAAVSAGGFGGVTLRGPVPSIDLVFSRPVDPSTLTVGDLSLTRGGGSELLSTATSVAQLSPTTFRIGGLGTLTAASGDYAFTVRTSGVNDSDGVAGIGVLTERFTIDAAGPTIAALDEITPNPRNAAISTLDLAFSKSLAAGTFTTADLALTRGGKTVSLGTAHLVALDDVHFRIAGLAAATGLAGSYQLAINAAGVTDLLGNPGSGVATRTWTVSIQKPAAPTNLAITPDRGVSATDKVTNTGALAITGSVAKGVTRVRATDRTTGAALGEIAVTGATFSLPAQFSLAGLHDIAVEALDAASNVSGASALRLFIDLTAPTATLEAISPTPRSTPVASIAITFSEPLDATTFTTADLALRRDGVAVPLGAAVTLQPAAAGAYVVNGLGALTDKPGVYELIVNAATVQDLAGNAGQGSATTKWRRLEGDKLKQFAAFAGSYTGLILVDEPTHATSGIVSLLLTRTGGFTGTTTYAGRKYALKGTLDADGQWTGVAGKGATALGLGLTLVTTEGANAIVGTVSGTAGRPGFVADRLLFSKTHPTALAGRYVVILTAASAGAAPGVPTGDGFGVVTIDATGKLTAAGEFADGTKFSQKTVLGGEDEWPFYVSTDGGRGSAISRVLFREVEALSDLDGTVHWFRAARPAATSFAGAFTARLPLVGSAYAKPVAAQPAFDFGTAGQHAEMIVSGSSLASGITLPFTFDAKGVAAFAASDPRRPLLKLSLPDGRISGSLLIPGDKAATTFRGAVLPRQKSGAGYFLRLPSGGSVELVPRP